MQNIATLMAVCLATIAGDYFIKLGTVSQLGLKSTPFMVGAGLYTATAVGWFHLMKSHSLVSISIMYSSSIIVMLTALGVFVFDEPLEPRQLFGAGLAIISVIIMG